MKDLIAKKPINLEYDDVFDMIEDILVYLDKGDEEEYITNQHLIGMKFLFRGFSIKVWKGTNFAEGKYKYVNKILVKHCVQFYKECWDHRNEIKHDPQAQRERAIKWYRNMKTHIERNEPMQVKLFMIKNNIEIDRSRTETILQVIYNVKKMIQKIERLPNMDIRRYFGPREQ